MSDSSPNDSDSGRRRYQISETEGKRVLQCSNASNLRLHVVPGLSVDAAGRRNFPSQSIFLDGVYTEAPFLDNKRRQYSLDHHAGVVRALTLATCEQAAVMLLNGLPLDEGNWEIYVNDPDLDAILAAWLLLNHKEMLKNDQELLRAAMPMIRIEGIIDAHGLGKEALTGLPEDLLEGHKQHLDSMLQSEQQMKEQRGDDDAPDPDELEYARESLIRLDNIFLTDTYLSRLLEVEEIASRPIQGSRIAVLCRSRQGIYEVEMSLRERYGRQLAIVILHRGPGKYTLRLVDRFLHANLRHAYRALNRQDPNVNSRQGNQWGGADDIGGSPRETDSGLGPQAVLEIVYDACRYRGPFHRLTHALQTLCGLRNKKNTGKKQD